MSAPPAFAPRRVLAASDLSPASESAMRWAAMLARLFDAKLGVAHAHHVEFPPYFSPAQIKTILRETEAAQRRARAHVSAWFRAVCGCPAEVLISDEPPIDAVLETARRWKADLLVLGTHGRTGVGRLWLGSVAAATARRSPCPVLVVPPEAAARPPESVAWADRRGCPSRRVADVAEGLARAAGGRARRGPDAAADLLVLETSLAEKALARPRAPVLSVPC